MRANRFRNRLSSSLPQSNGPVSCAGRSSRRARAVAFPPRSIEEPFSVRRASRRGLGLGGASSAARKAVHCASSRKNKRRSAKVSAAAVKPLSSRNSLTVLSRMAAASCSIRLAEGVVRISIRSVLASVSIAIATKQVLRGSHVLSGLSSRRCRRRFELLSKARLDRGAESRYQNRFQRPSQEVSAGDPI
jgi:hypothetical protein